MVEIILQHLVIYFESTCSTFAKIGYFSLQISGTFSGMSGKSQIFAGNPHMVQTSRKIINISIKIDTNVAPTTDTRGSGGTHVAAPRGAARRGRLQLPRQYLAGLRLRPAKFCGLLQAYHHLF